MPMRVHWSALKAEPRPNPAHRPFPLHFQFQGFSPALAWLPIPRHPPFTLFLRLAHDGCAAGWNPD